MKFSIFFLTVFFISCTEPTLDERIYMSATQYDEQFRLIDDFELKHPIFNGTYQFHSVNACISQIDAIAKPSNKYLINSLMKNRSDLYQTVKKNKESLGYVKFECRQMISKRNPSCLELKNDLYKTQRFLKDGVLYEKKCIKVPPLTEEDKKDSSLKMTDKEKKEFYDWRKANKNSKCFYQTLISSNYYLENNLTIYITSMQPKKYFPAVYSGCEDHYISPTEEGFFGSQR